LITHRRLRRSIWWALILTWAAWLTAALTVLLIAFYDVEVVMCTGPIMAVLALIVIILSRVGGHPALALLGLANIAVCLLFFGLVVLLDWSPSEAETPFTVMGFAFTLGTLPWAWQLTRRAPHDINPGECQACGYLLFGLTEPRCPECGSPFDPALLRNIGPPQTS